MFGVPMFHMYDEEYFETAKEAEQWIKNNSSYKILGMYKDPDEKFLEYRFNRAVMNNANMNNFHAVVIYEWRPRKGD